MTWTAVDDSGLCESCEGSGWRGPFGDSPCPCEADAAILRRIRGWGFSVVVIGTESANGETWRTARWIGHDIDAAKRDFGLYQWTGKRLYQRDSSGQWTELTPPKGDLA